jgi:hypothetical protein
MRSALFNSIKSSWLLICIINILLISVSACQPGRSDLDQTSTPIDTSTSTITVTPLPTVTPHPSLTPTATQTPLPSSTATPSETPAIPRLAQLWTKRDINDTLIDWSYSHITDIGWNKKGKVIHFSATLSFQLLDRAIHRQTIVVIGKPLTVYFLNVRRQVGKELQPARLIVGGAFGNDIPLGIIPAGGPSYVKFRLMTRREPFDPYIIHVNANQPYSLRSEEYPDTLLTDLEQILAQLPDQVILLADQTIIIDPDSIQRFEYDLRTVPYLVARYYPWLLLDDYDLFTGPNQAAIEMADYLYLNKTFTKPIEWYSGETLVIITGS